MWTRLSYSQWVYVIEKVSQTTELAKQYLSLKKSLTRTVYAQDHICQYSKSQLGYLKLILRMFHSISLLAGSHVTARQQLYK